MRNLTKNPEIYNQQKHYYRALQYTKDNYEHHKMLDIAVFSNDQLRIYQSNVNKLQHKITMYEQTLKSLGVLVLILDACIKLDRDNGRPEDCSVCPLEEITEEAIERGFLHDGYQET